MAQLFCRHRQLKLLLVAGAIFLVGGTLQKLASISLAQDASPEILSPLELIASQVPIARARIEAFHGSELGKSQRTLQIVYWTPKDREPAPQYQERLSRVLRSVQDFYAREMARLGFGPMTYGLELDEAGLVKIHLVKGAASYEQYNVESGSRILEESIPVLAAAGVDATQETTVIFCNMSNWDPVAGTISQNSPYYAGGGLNGGTAWQVDSPILDPDLLSDNSTMLVDKQYGRVSLGKYNSIFVGGVCHELGHAFGLPHNQERPDEAMAFGTALMGSGNRTYGEELRGEGKGSFLTLGEGLRLAAHPLFLKSDQGLRKERFAEIVDLQVELSPDSKSFSVRGRVRSEPECYAIVAYMDPAGGSDYDATTVTAIPEVQIGDHERGKFQLGCSALKRGSGGTLRLVACTVGGGSISDNTLSIPYHVAEDGTVDLATYNAKISLAPLCEALDRGDRTEAVKILSGLKEQGADSSIVAMGESIVGGAKESKLHAKEVEGEVAFLSDLRPDTVRLGYGRPVYNRLPERQGVIVASGEVFGQAIYAHAHSVHAYELGKQWNRFTAKVAIADGRHGSCVFVVLGDGEELYRSRLLKEGELGGIDLSLRGIDRLELVVEDGGDGKSGDWGLWLVPKVEK